MDPRPVQTQGVLRSAASAQAHHAIDSPLHEVLPYNGGHILRSAVHHHAMRLVAAGAEKRTADGENAGKGSAIEIDWSVLEHATKTVPKTYNLPSVVAKRGFADASDGSVQARAVAAGRENPDAFNFCGHEKQYGRRWSICRASPQPARCRFEACDYGPRAGIRRKATPIFVPVFAHETGFASRLTRTRAGFMFAAIARHVLRAEARCFRQPRLVVAL